AYLTLTKHSPPVEPDSASCTSLPPFAPVGLPPCRTPLSLAAPLFQRRPMRRAVPILVGLLALAAPLVGQARSGHFYHVNYYQVRPGEEKAYDSALVNVVTPVFDELVKRKAMVS